MYSAMPAPPSPTPKCLNQVPARSARFEVVLLRLKLGESSEFSCSSTKKHFSQQQASQARDAPQSLDSPRRWLGDARPGAVLLTSHKNQHLRHFSLIAGIERSSYPPARPTSLPKLHVFAGGSLGEFYEPSGEGQQVFSLHGKLACRSFQLFLVFLSFFVFRRSIWALAR
jgi:hypothetical protein